MGSPGNVVAEVANRLAEYDEKLRAGEIVITGAFSEPARAVPRGRDEVVKSRGWGRVSVRVQF